MTAVTEGGPDLGQMITDILRQRDETAAKERAEMFTRIGVGSYAVACRACGAVVADEQQHYLFHKALKQNFEDIVKSMNTMVEVITDSRSMRKSGGGNE